MKDQFTIGIDYGSLSARAVVCRVSDGEVLAEAESAYPHGVMYDALPCGVPLPQDWALQHPQDYLDALYGCLPAALKKSGVPASAVIGLGIDFTGSTPLPLGRDGQPLCFDPAFADKPHAYVKLWKHHAATREADELNALAAQHDPDLLLRYGGRVSSEVLFAKLLQILHEDPATFSAVDQFMEAGDWVTQCLTGESVRAAAMAANKAFYYKCSYPAFLEEAYPVLRGMRDTLLRGRMIGIGQPAGRLTADMAARLGLPAGLTVAAPHLDAHAAVAALGISGPGDALCTLGTSGGVLMADTAFHPVDGTCGITYEGMLPGLYGYANGQAAVGDILGWFADHCVPAAVTQEAQARGVSVHQLLAQKAAALRPGQSGLIALDWWNGNRSVLQDMHLSGLLLGMTLQTQPHEIYRALMESLAFGLRRILDASTAAGMRLNTLRLAGGISYKNPQFVQIISDVTRLPLLGSKQVSAPAVGAAIFAAVAAGAYDSVAAASARMNCLSDVRYIPNLANSVLYDPLYEEYKRLHDYFGRGGNDVMHRLREIAAQA